MFNLLTSFVAAFVVARGSPRCSGAPVGRPVSQLPARPPPHPPLRARHRPGVRVGRRAIVTRDEALEPRSRSRSAWVWAYARRVGALLELDDVYWSEEGRLSVQIALAVTALLAALALAMRFLRRGEQVVLEHALAVNSYAV